MCVCVSRTCLGKALIWSLKCREIEVEQKMAFSLTLVEFVRQRDGRVAATWHENKTKQKTETETETQNETKHKETT